MKIRAIITSDAAVLLLAALLVAALHSGHALDSDEGVILSGAWHLHHGLRPYTDFFEYVGPANFYLVHWAWIALGPHYWVAKLLGAGAIVAAAFGVYRLAQAALPPGAPRSARALAVLAAALYCLLSFCWQTINHNTFSLAPAVWSAVFAARTLAAGRHRDAAASGALAGLAALFLQHRAAVVTVAIALALFCVRGRRRCLPAFLAGVAAGAAPLLCWPVETIVQQLVLFPLNHYRAVNQLSPVLPAIAALCWLGTAWILWRQRNGPATLLLLLQPLLLAATQRADLTHVTQNLFPLIALLPAMAAGRPSFTDAQVAKQAAVLAGLLAPLLLLAPMRWSNDQSRQELLRAVSAQCGGSQYLYAGPFIPELYFETGKLNPTRFSVLLTGLNTPAQFRDAAGALALAAPKCALTDYALASKFGYSLDNPVDRYLASHYVPAAQWGGRLVLWRRQLP
jgi:hypothetical protein